MYRLAIAAIGSCIAFAGPAFAQTAPTPPTAEDYACALGGVCEGPADQPAQPGRPAGSPRVTATRSFALSRPVSSPAPAPTRRAAPARHVRPTGRIDLRLLFDSGSSILSSQSQHQLLAFAEALKRPQLSSLRVRIEGHTDSVGGHASNLALSQRRAQSVADFLTAQGVDARRLEVRGFGPDRPLPGRRASSPENRRVEAVRIS